jgi:hypothetical protein
MTPEDAYSTLRQWMADGFAPLNQSARLNWFHDAGIAELIGKVSPDLPANDLAPQLLRVAYLHDGEGSLRKIVAYVRDQNNGYEEPRIWLDALLAQPDLATLLFPNGADSWADDPNESLRAALARFARMPVDQPPPNLPLPPIQHFHFHRNPDFVGREVELQKITVAIKNGQGAAVVAAGLGGVGKTQLAVEWVHRYGYYFQGGVFWLDFSEAGSIPLSIAAAGKGYRWRRYDQLNLEAQVEAVCAAWQAETPTLLIFDNCEDTALAQTYAPKNSGARVLVTSRDQTWGQKVRGMRQIAIKTLPRPDSIELLQRLRPDLDPAIANAIAGEVGDLPLALHIAGSFLAHYATATQGNPATYLEQLQASNPIAQLGKQGERLDKRKVAQPTRHSQDVERTFRISMERLATEENSDLSHILLLLMAQFALGVPLPVAWLMSALPEGTDELDASDALDRLVAVGLAEAPQAGFLRMHRLVAQVVIGATEAERVTVTISQSEDILLEVKPEYGHPDFVVQMEEWLPHARHIATRALLRRDERAGLLSNWVGYLLQHLGLYSEAKYFFENVVDIYRAVLGARHSDTATSLNNLAGLFYAQGLYERALPLLEEALVIRREVLGAQHPDTASSLNNLAELYREQGEYERALPLYEEGLAILSEVLGARHPNTATSLNNLALLYDAQGANERALPLYEEALAITREVLGARHPDTAIRLNNLAGLYEGQGSYDRALPLYEEAVSILVERLGVEHPNTKGVIQNRDLCKAEMGNG